MKIPQFQYSRVPQAQTIDTGAIAGAARAQMGISKTLVEVGTKFGEQILEAETEAEYQRVKDSVQADANQLWSDLQDEPQFDENNNPTHNALRKRFDDGYKKIVDKYQGNLQFHPNKANISNVAADIGMAQGQAIDAEVRRRQVGHARSQVFTTISNIDYNNAQSIADARDAIKAAGQIGTLSQMEVAESYDGIDANSQDNAIRSGFQFAREAGHGQNFADSVEYPPSFDQATKDKYDNYMRTYLDRDAAEAERAVNKADREARAAESAAWEKLVPTLHTLKRGDNVADSVIEKVQEYIDTTTDPSRKFDAQVALRTNIAISSMKGMAVDERAEAINATFGGATDDVSSAVNANIRQAAAQMNQSIKSDPWRAFTMYGDDGPASMTFSDAVEAGDPQAYFDYIKERRAKIAEWTGMPVPVMSDQDVAAVAAGGMDSVQTVITNYSPDDAYKVLELVYKGDAPEVAVAGAIMLQHDGGGVIEAYTRGEKSDTPFRPTGMDANTNETVDQVFAGLMESVFPEDRTHNAAFRQVVDSVYAGMSRGDGKFDSALFRKAFSMAAGGVEKINDEMVLMPDRSWSAEDFQTAIKDLTMDDIGTMGGLLEKNVKGQVWSAKYATGVGQMSTIVKKDVEVPPAEVLDMIKNGEVRFVQTSVRGKYNLIADGFIIKNAKDEAFVLDMTQGQ